MSSIRNSGPFTEKIRELAENLFEVFFVNCMTARFLRRELIKLSNNGGKTFELWKLFASLIRSFSTRSLITTRGQEVNSHNRKDYLLSLPKKGKVKYLRFFWKVFSWEFRSILYRILMDKRMLKIEISRLKKYCQSLPRATIKFDREQRSVRQYLQRGNKVFSRSFIFTVERNYRDDARRCTTPSRFINTRET